MFLQHYYRPSTSCMILKDKPWQSHGMGRYVRSTDEEEVHNGDGNKEQRTFLTETILTVL